ncbi:hypothetical protein D3C73_1412410 [compost metagenome]
MRARQIPGPDRRAKAVVAIVGQCQSFGFGLETGDDQHRTEDLIAADMGLYWGVDKNGWANSRRMNVTAAIQCKRSLRFTVANKIVHGIGMCIVDKRSHRGIGIKRVAWLPVFCLLF